MLAHLSKQIRAKEVVIEGWFAEKRTALPDPIYASVDLRNAGFKLAPVDTNIFPAGFNNLCPSYRRACGKRFRAGIERVAPGAERILILTESHTRNIYYQENIDVLTNILGEEGFAVEAAPLEKLTYNNEKQIIERETFVADLILLNNDLSTGIPDLLRNPLSQSIVPTPHIGWHWRKKSDHFRCYRELIAEFAELIDVDTWLLSADFEQVPFEVDVTNEDDRERLAVQVDTFLARLRPEYEKRGIKDRPYVFIKNESGTYGMGIITAESGDQIRTMNRKQRTKMAAGKGGVKIRNLLIQEGLATTDRFRGLVAEPVMYLVDNYVCGGFFRLNEEKDARDNLNSPGMSFTKLCFHDLMGYSNEYRGDCDLECLELVYRTIANVASLAAGCEIVKLH